MNQDYWTPKEIKLYNGANHPISLQVLYEHHSNGPGVNATPNQKTEFLLGYLDKELSKLPIKEWAEILSFRPKGSHLGLRKLENMAIAKINREGMIRLA